MYIIKVIPIGRGIGVENLTYFSKSPAERGSLVPINLRKKEAFGLVTECKEAKEIKSELRSLPFSIKRISGGKPRKFLLPQFIKSSEKIANYYATTTGAVLQIFLPKKILENDIEMQETSVNETIKDLANNELSHHEILLMQNSLEERLASYKSIVREEFARNKSVFICVPTIEDLDLIVEQLSRGIEQYTLVFHSDLGVKNLKENWSKIILEKHPVLILGTGPFLSVPREDISTIIFEKESSRGYSLHSRPYLDFRTCAEIVAKDLSARLIFADTLLRVETLWKAKNEHYMEYSPLSFRPLSATTSKLISMRKPEEMKEKKFDILSDEVKKIILEQSQNSERTVLFCARKGENPLTICADCGTTVTCKNCNTPTVLYRKKVGDKESGLFVCHRCGERREAKELCVYCNSWRLHPLGIGTDLVEREIKKIRPEAKVLVFDSDKIKTRKQALKLRDQFYKTAGGILVGTEMMIPYLREVENSIVVSIDSIFSIPDFRIHEKIFQIILSLRAIATKQLIVQTRLEKIKIFEDAIAGNLMDFYRNEISEREQVGFPPFSNHIKLTIKGNRKAVLEQMENIKKIIPKEVTVFESFGSKIIGKITLNGLVTIEKGGWPDQKMSEILKNLPQNIEIRVDPENLL